MPKTFREMEKRIMDDGWQFYKQKGSHCQYKHPVKPGKVTIPNHGGADIDSVTEKSILKQAGISD